MHIAGQRKVLWQHFLAKFVAYMSVVTVFYFINIFSI